MSHRSCAALLSCVLIVTSYADCRAELRDDALRAAKKATTFLTDQVSTEGGYLWAYSADLQFREGEGTVESKTIWIQPPGTPTVGEAFVDLYLATGEQQFLRAATDAADALRRGQMRSGGWQASIEFDPDRRKRWAYRVDPVKRREKDQSSLDDDKTQSAIRFLIRLDQAIEFKNEAIHEMTLYALDGLIQKGQFSGGGFPQVWTGQRSESEDTPPRKANYPDRWPRTYQGHNEYWHKYTLNDHLARDVMTTLFLAHDVYGDESYRRAAIALADSLLAAQMPHPQPAWAQQYNAEMQPIWARKFEPTAIVTSESFSVIQTLMLAYRRTSDRKYLDAIPPALDYLKSCEFADGRVARFYELKTNRPLYFTLDYQLTYDDSDLPTHYGFQLDSKVDRLRRDYQKLVSLAADQLNPRRKPPSPPSDRTVKRLIDTQDENGAWTTDATLRYHRRPGPIIEMRKMSDHLTVLANYLQHHR